MKKENIIGEYTEAVQKELITYLKMIYKKGYNTKIANEFIEAYIYEKYYNFIQEEIWEDRVKTEFFKIQQKYQITEVDIMKRIMEEIICFDTLKKNNKMQQTVEKLEQMQRKELNTKTDKFEEKLIEEINQQVENKKQMLKKYKSDVFFIKKKLLDEEKTIYRITMSHKIKFDDMYSKIIINKIFNEGVISEDKLIVEYNLVALRAIEDILTEKFNNKYIVDFNKELLQKKAKQARILKSIDDEALKEKIILSINADISDIQIREEIYELMRLGFKFALVIYKTTNINKENIVQLNSFEYIITNQKNIQKIKELDEQKQIQEKIIIEE